MSGRYSRGSLWEQPKQDTGWGLIFRLNDLLNKVERDADNGDFLKWDLHLNRIYSNIIFKNPMEIAKDKNGKIVDIVLGREDVEEFSLFNTKIENKKSEIIKQKIITTDNPSLEENKKINKLNNELWAIIYMKEIWLRKKMTDLHLYLRQVEHDPGKAIYGG